MTDRALSTEEKNAFLLKAIDRYKDALKVEKQKLKELQKDINRLSYFSDRDLGYTWKDEGAALARDIHTAIYPIVRREVVKDTSLGK